MALVHTPPGELGAQAPAFSLEDPAGRTYTFADVAGPKGTVIAFICNHCPYVIAVAEQLGDDLRALAVEGIGAALIMSNDYAAYPDDAPTKMTAFARKNGLDAPYLVDETQEVARAYGAVCTPDFFGFDAEGKLVYRGRLNATNPGRPPKPGDRAELVEAMTALARGEKVPAEQHASMGCSLKWRAPA